MRAEPTTAIVSGAAGTGSAGDEIAKLRKTIADAGFYAYDTTPEEMEHFRADPDAVTDLFARLMNRTLNGWLELAEDRLAGTGIQCYFAPGNDDPIFVDDILRSSATVINPEEGQVDLGDGFTMISVGYSNKTPWDSPRELPEDELAAYIAKQADVSVVSDAEPPGHTVHLRLAGGVPEEFSPVLAALPLAQAGFHLARLTGKRSYNFPSERAKQEHYATIHRATIGEPA